MRTGNFTFPKNIAGSSEAFLFALQIMEIRVPLSRGVAGADLGGEKTGMRTLFYATNSFGFSEEGSTEPEELFQCGCCSHTSWVLWLALLFQHRFTCILAGSRATVTCC